MPQKNGPQTYEKFIHDRVYGPISGTFLYFPLEIHVVCYQINLMRK